MWNIWFLKRWWIFLLVIDLFFLVPTIASPHLPNFSQKWRLIKPFNLGIENNISVWWSGMTILIAAILCYEISTNKNSATKLAWLVLAIVLAGFSLDEVGSFHERFGNLRNLLPVGLVLGFLILYSLTKLYKSTHTRKSAVLFAVAFIILGIVAIEEKFFYLIPNWKPWLLGLTIGIEEATEFLGIFFIYFAIIQQRIKQSDESVKLLLPVPATFEKLKIILMIALLAHVVGCFIMLSIWEYPFSHGNPMKWFPTSIYVCTFVFAFWKFLNSVNPSKKKRWAFISIACLISSVGAMTELFFIMLPGLSSIISPYIIREYFLIFYLIQLALVGLLIFTYPSLLKHTFLIGALILGSLVLFSFWSDNIWLRYTILGLVAFSVYILVLSIVDDNLSTSNTVIEAQNKKRVTEN